MRIQNIMVLALMVCVLASCGSAPAAAAPPTAAAAPPTAAPIAQPTATSAPAATATPRPTEAPRPTATPRPATATATPKPQPTATTAPVPAAAKPAAKPIAGGACPADFPIKGNIGAKEKIYHRPGGASYRQTEAEACFDTDASAQAAGYRRAER